MSNGINMIVVAADGALIGSKVIPGTALDFNQAQPSVSNDIFNDVTYDNALNEFVAIGSDANGTELILTSSDGINWKSAEIQ